MNQFGPLVTGDWLAEDHDDPTVTVIDFRWYLDGRSGRAAYEQGHIPGAVFVDLEHDVTGRAPGFGRHPLPDAPQFERAMRDAGVCRDSRVVVYDDSGGFAAARLWWLLRYFGHGAVAVLDGGLQAWPAQLSSGRQAVSRGDFRAAPPRVDTVLTFEDVRRLDADVTLLDARAAERYRGEVEPRDPKAGHIPGALSAPYTDNLAADGRFADATSLRQRFAELGVTSGLQTVAYCGSGISACHTLLALEVAGLPGGRLYAGSWSDWSSRDAPVAVGPQAGPSDRMGS